MNQTKLDPAELRTCVGRELGVSSWITIDQDRIDEFAHCTEDEQWIHVDVERAKRESPFGGTIAHGYLTLSLLAPTSFEVLCSKIAIKQALNYGLDKVRFPNLVRAGSRVRNHIKVLSLEDKGNGRLLLTTENSMEIEHESKPALVATVLAILAG